MTISNQRTYTPVLITALIVTLAIAGYLAFDRNQLSHSNSQFKTMVKEAEAIQTDLQISYDDVSERLDEMKTGNVELNALIEEQKAELSKQKDKVNSLIWTKKKWKEAKTEIMALEEMGRTYLNQIQKLNDENTSLTEANITLKNEKNVLAQRIVRNTEENEELTAKKVELENYNTELKKERDFLNEKVDVASVIKVNDIIATGYKVNKKGGLIKRKYAKYVNKISVCFTTDANLVTDNEEEEFYLRIIDPLGETMAIEDLGSGILINTVDGKPIRYTNSGTTEYKNKEKQLCLDWQPELRFQKGLYEIEIYNKGYKVGNTTMKLK